MRPRVLIPLAISVLLIALILLFHHPTKTLLFSPSSPTADGSKNQLVSTNFTPAKQTTSMSRALSVSNAGVEYIQKIKADPQYDWKQPINFYGRVVDENNAVVVGASVHFEWTDISPTGTSEANTVSDENGLFSLTSRHGKRLIVDVSKNGYYSSGNARGGAFEYANPFDGLFHPDPMNPVVFHLRKKGVGVDLIASHAPMSTFIRIAPPTNGAPVFLDFFSQKINDAGQLKIEGWKEGKDFKTAQNNWALRLTIPDGGFAENTDEFPFEAPDTDYLPVVEWHFTNGTPDWRGVINKKYYMKFGNPPRYGRITVDTTAFSPGVLLEFAINPDGSRNLEPK
jgi:hypothetical protein